MSQDRPPEYVNSLERGLSVIRAFTPRHGSLTISEVAERAGLTAAAARRFLRTLEYLGYVRLDGRRYSLRPTVLELGYSYLSSVHAWDAAFPIMEEVSREIGENCLAGVLDGADVVCVARTSHRLVTVAVYVGGRIPAHASSMGRVLLAGLSESQIDNCINAERTRPDGRTTLLDADRLREEIANVRTQGWSVVENELEDGLTGVAVPIYGVGGSVVAALNVSVHGNRLTRTEAEDRVMPALQRGASEISLLFGTRPTSWGDRKLPADSSDIAIGR